MASSYALVINRVAQSEIAEAKDYYEDHSPGLGQDFLQEVDRTLDFIRDFPFGYSESVPGLRHAVLRRFPYAIYYRIREEKIYILGCVHGKRRPDTWSNR